MLRFFSLCLIIAALLCSISLDAQPQSRRAVEPAPSQDAQKISRLKTLIENAEKALANKDEDAAVKSLDEAKALIDDWPQDLLDLEDTVALLERMKKVGKELGDDTEESGIKSEEEIESLSEDDLRAELELVEAAEADLVFDFPIDLNDKVLAFVGAFSGRQKGVIQNSLSRGSRYMPMIHEVLTEVGIPLDLAFLPIIESGFRNEARSRAAAVGMWQFIAPTGRTYGLRIDSWVDERRDPVKATWAAARHLKDLYERTDDWYLALAGYNAGPGRVNGAIQGTGSRNFWDHARSRFLRTETKNYVPQFCAAVLIGKHPESYGLEVAQLEPFAYETIEVDKSVSLMTLGQRTGIDSEILRDLNPELTRRTTPPRLHSLKVPIGTSEKVLETIAEMSATERLEFRTYRIRQGDNLARVSARYNISPDELLAINNISRSQFRVGRNIQVPVVVKVSPPASRTPARR
jgi:membrane-bound lytic murein transglycosylase D